MNHSLTDYSCVISYFSLYHSFPHCISNFSCSSYRDMLRSRSRTPMLPSVQSPRRSPASGSSWMTVPNRNTRLCLTRTRHDTLLRRNLTCLPRDLVLMERPWLWAKAARLDVPRRTRTCPRELFHHTSSFALRCAV